MLELYLDPESFRTLSQFKNKKCAVGLKPLLLFAGTPFESPVPNEYTLAKSFFTDFFKGEPADKVDVEGLQYIVSISARDSVDGEEAKPSVWGTCCMDLAGIMVAERLPVSSNDTSLGSD